MRTKATWLQIILEADRNGIESWEMYCFIHGFPTRNVGSWLPGQATPWCGNRKCATLAQDLWPQMWQRGQGT
eukprot:6267087-Karenia_brevis.AAC.1